MVCGHTSIPSYVSDWIWSFHMPLFFFISGMLFASSKYPSFCSFLKRRFRTLLIPYFVFSIVVLLVMRDKPFIQWISEGWMNGYALWFLPVLFLAEIISFEIIQKFTVQKKIFCGAILLGTVGYIFYWCDVRLYYNVDVAFSASLFYLIGYMVNKELKKIRPHWSSLLILMIINISLSILLPRTDMACNCCGLYGLNAMNAIIGSLAIILIAKKLEAVYLMGPITKFFLWAGKNTLVILGFSQMINMLIKQYMQSIVPQNMLFSILRHTLLWIILWILSIIVNKYIPEIIGKQRNMNNKSVVK